MSDLTPSKIEEIANDEGNLACQVRYAAGWTAEAAERAYWMACHSVKARYMTAETPRVTETVNQSPMTHDEHDAALWGVWDTEMSLLEMTR